VMPYLKKMVESVLPLVGFCAGAILCGPYIVTSKDLNAVQTSHFEGLNATPFNISPHYPKDDHSQSVKDEWLADYHFFHDNPVVMMCDDAYIKVDGKKTSLVRGEAYILRRDQKKEKLEEGKLITL
jgi:peptidase E